MSKRILLFVYGTLLKGEAFHHWMGSRFRAEFVQEDTIRGFVLFSDGGLPRLLRSEVRDYPEVSGEVYTISEEVLSNLRSFECHYQDEKTTTVGGKEVLVFVSVNVTSQLHPLLHIKRWSEPFDWRKEKEVK